ncbi:MAG: FixH family protein [Ignavibacteria bacterium]|jgi:hypothetical protein
MKKKISTPNRRLSWGTGIVISIAVFMSITILMGIYMMNQDVNLVADDYYDQEIKYQQQIDRIDRTKRLDQDEIISFNGSVVEIGLPPKFSKKNIQGEIYFYRPSNADNDLRIPLSVDSIGVQLIPVTAIERGLWTVKIRWEYLGEEYFDERRIILK